MLDDGLRVRHPIKSGPGHKMDGGGIHGRDQIDFDSYA